MKERFHRFSTYSSNDIMETKKEDNYMEATKLGKFTAKKSNSPRLNWPAN